MKKSKISLANMQGKLTRAQMKKIAAGSSFAPCPPNCSGDCTFDEGLPGEGHCRWNTEMSKCYCVS